MRWSCVHDPGTPSAESTPEAAPAAGSGNRGEIAKAVCAAGGDIPYLPCVGARRRRMSESPDPDRPDFSHGFPLAELREGTTLGRIGDEDVVVVRRGGELFALGAWCTHYH